jgi:hypothetical protein
MQAGENDSTPRRPPTQIKAQAYRECMRTNLVAVAASERTRAKLGFCRNFCANSLYPIAYFSHRSVISSNLAAKHRVLAPFRAAGVRPSEVAEALHPWPAAAVCDPTATWPIFASDDSAMSH